MSVLMIIFSVYWSVVQYTGPLTPPPNMYPVMFTVHICNVNIHHGWMEHLDFHIVPGVFNVGLYFIFHIQREEKGINDC